MLVEVILRGDGQLAISKVETAMSVRRTGSASIAIQIGPVQVHVVDSAALELADLLRSAVLRRGLEAKGKKSQ